MKFITLLIISSLLLPGHFAQSGNYITETRFQVEDEEKPFSFYPIPAREELNIKYNLPEPTDIDISIRNSIGVEMTRLNHTTTEKSGVLSIDTSKFPAGIYFIELRSASLKEFKKIIVI